MIGRGTRLRPDLFGLGQDKEYFLVFDACQNFEFFNQNPRGAPTSQPEPLSQRLFKARLMLLQELRRWVHREPASASLAQSLADTLHARVAAMNADNFIVRPQRQYVEPFQDRARWQHLSRTDAAQLTQYVAGLPAQLPEEEETTKRFDLLLLQLQLARLEGAERFASMHNRLLDLVANLETKADIPKVAAQLAFIQEIQSEEFWEGNTLSQLEQVRQRLRQMVQYADKSRRLVIYTDFEDKSEDIREAAISYLTTGANAAQYKKRVEQFLRAHRDEPVIQKIRWAIPLEPRDLAALEDFFYRAEEVGGRETFVQIYGCQPNLAAFIRSLVGLDRAKAKERFTASLTAAASQPIKSNSSTISSTAWQPTAPWTPPSSPTSPLLRFTTRAWMGSSLIIKPRLYWQ